MGIFTGKERRRYIRLATELSVEFKINGEAEDTPWHKGVTRDISLEGLCLITDLLPKQEWEEISRKKRHLYLHIDFPRHKEKAEAKVQKIEVGVAWHHREGKKEGKDIYRIGLQFIEIEKGSLEMIHRYIADNLITKYKQA
ncbi:MAG: PilZ domain-containing protein [Candidatus Omnitrophica bacterium]|nr:PilZ domain-containing protein [Candidatus Omnitrophota bacterium]